MEEPRIETAQFNPPPKYKPSRMSRRRSIQALYDLIAGECIRIYHPDVSCSSLGCSLTSTVSTLRHALDREYEHYHEDRYVMVVKRTK